MLAGSPTAAASVSAARVSASAGRSSTSDDDIDASFALNHFVAPQPQLGVGRAFAGLQLVFPAVPGADDVRLLGIVALTEKGPVGPVEIDHPVPDDAFAGRAALMQAMI